MVLFLLHFYFLQSNAIGSALLKQVQEHLNLIEWEYFGLYFDNITRSGWLDPNKLIKKQLKKG